jgi:hypothetical protein
MAADSQMKIVFIKSLQICGYSFLYPRISSLEEKKKVKTGKLPWNRFSF